jgi:hypothetical protein
MRKPILAVLTALTLAGLTLAPLAQAFDDPDTNIQKPGHVSISRPLG